MLFKGWWPVFYDWSMLHFRCVDEKMIDLWSRTCDSSAWLPARPCCCFVPKVTCCSSWTNKVRTVFLQFAGPFCTWLELLLTTEHARTTCLSCLGRCKTPERIKKKDMVRSCGVTMIQFGISTASTIYPPSGWVSWRFKRFWTHWSSTLTTAFAAQLCHAAPSSVEFLLLEMAQLQGAQLRNIIKLWASADISRHDMTYIYIYISMSLRMDVKIREDMWRSPRLFGFDGQWQPWRSMVHLLATLSDVLRVYGWSPLPAGGAKVAVVSWWLCDGSFMLRIVWLTDGWWWIHG